MGGIAGVLRRDGRPAEPAVLDRMGAAIAHRGPDGTSRWSDGPVALLHAALRTTPEAAAALLSQDPNIQEIARNNGFLEISLRDGITDYTFIPQRLLSAGYRLTLLKEEEVNLETAFMRLTKGMVQ